MSFDYLGFQSVPREMIEEFGRLLTLRSASVGDVYDDVLGVTVPGGAPTLRDFTGVVMAPTVEYTQSVGGLGVQVRDMLVLMGPDIEPLMTDVILIDDEPWQIINIRAEAPGGVPLMYTVQVRP